MNTSQPNPTSQAEASSLSSYTFEPTKWATLRTENVESIARKYISNPSLVHVISDRRLNSNELVLLKKDGFESLIKTLRDLQSGQAAIEHNIEALVHAADLLERMVKDSNATLEEPGIKSAVALMKSVTAQLHSTILVKNQVQPIDTAELTEEEKTMLDDDEEVLKAAKDINKRYAKTMKNLAK